MADAPKNVDDLLLTPAESTEADVRAWLALWTPLVAGVALLLGWWLSQVDNDGFARIALTPVLILIVPLVLCVGAVVALCSYTLRRASGNTRYRHGMTILGYLENAMRLNFPLDRYLQAAQESEHGAVRHGLIALRMALSRGMPVGEAVERTAPEVPADITGAIKGSERIGQLQPTLTRIMTRDAQASDVAYDGATPFYRFYIPMMLLAVCGAAIFFDIYVAPKFRDIFKDFHTTIPPLTQRLFSTLGFVLDNDFFLPVLGWTLIVAAVLIVARGLQQFYQRLRGRSSRILFFPGVSLKPVLWYLPVWRGMVRDRAMSAVLEFLADALRAGLPLVQAVNASMQLGMPAPLRRKMEAWRNAMLAGSAPAEAARLAGLPELLAGFLQTAPRGGAAIGGTLAGPEMFDFLATYYHERVRRLAIFLRAAAEPVVVVIMGILVCQVVLALFLPLVALMNAVIAAGEKGFL